MSYFIHNFRTLFSMENFSTGILENLENLENLSTGWTVLTGDGDFLCNKYFVVLVQSMAFHPGNGFQWQTCSVSYLYLHETCNECVEDHLSPLQKVWFSATALPSIVSYSMLSADLFWEGQILVDQNGMQSLLFVLLLFKFLWSRLKNAFLKLLQTLKQYLIDFQHCQKLSNLLNCHLTHVMKWEQITSMHGAEELETVSNTKQDNKCSHNKHKLTNQRHLKQP